MTIALVTRGLDPGQGASGYAARLLAELGNRVEVVGLAQAPGLRFAWAHRALRTRFERVLSLERTVDHDLIRVGGGIDADAAAAVGARASRRIAWLERQGWDRAGVVVANSERVAARLRTLTCTRVEVVRTGVDLQRFHPRQHGTTGRILFAAHGWRRKGFDRAVRAVHELGTHELWVAGRDSRRWLRMRWARSLLGDRLRDLGPTVDLASTLHEVDVVLHPTRYDPASNLVLEAMAAGVPAVTTVQDGSAELLPRMLVASGDVLPALRDALAGGASLARDLRRRAEAWPDSRNATELEALLWECSR